MNLRRIDVFLFISIKEKLHKNICKRNKVLRKGFFIRHGSKENVIFQNVQVECHFFAKNYSKNQNHGIQSAENIFLFLKGKKRPWYLCFVPQSK